MNSDDAIDEPDAPPSDDHPKKDTVPSSRGQGSRADVPLTPGTVLPGTCLKCGASNPQGTRVCQSCGAALFEQCPRCGVEGSLGVRYCGSCGVLIPAYKEAQKALSSAQEHLGKSAYDAAQKEASRALRWGYFTDELRAVIETVADRRKTIEELGAQASRLVQNEEYEDAEELLRKALQLDPSRDDLKSLLADLPRRSLEHKVQTALAEAREAIGQRQFPIALKQLDWVLREQPENSDAAELRTAALKLKEDHRERMAEVAESLNASRVMDAIQQLESLKTDYMWDGEVERLLREAQTQKEQTLQELRAKAAELVEAEQYEDAETPLRSALELDPSREDIEALLSELPARIRERDVRRALKEANEAMEERRFPVALERCDSVLREQPDNPQAVELRAQAETLREDHRRRLSQVKAAMEGAQFDEALQQLKNLEEDYPWDSETKKLLQEAQARKNKRLTDFRARAMQLVNNEEYEDAESPLRSALELDPMQHDLKALLDEIPARIRGREIRRALSDAGRALEEKRFSVALEQCERVLQEDPDNEEAGVLKLHAEKVRKDHESRLARAKRLFEDAQLNAAMGQLGDLCRDYPWDEESGKLLARAKESKKTLDAIRARALALVKQEQYEEAEKPIRAALEIDQSQEDLKTILEQLPAKIRERDIRRALTVARTALQDKRYPTVLERCDWVLQQQPDHKDAVSLKARAEKLREDHRSRLEQAKKSLETLEAAELKKTLQELKALEKEYPWDKQATTLRQEITTQREDKTRRLHTHAIELVKKEQYEDAEDALRGALKLDPSKKDAAHLLKELPAKIQKREVTRALDEGREALREKRFSVALEHANWVLEEQPANKEAAEIKAQAEKLQLESKPVAIFGSYEAVARHARTPGVTVWTARPVGSDSPPAFAVKAFDPSEPGWDEPRVAAERGLFQDSLRTHLKVAASDGRHWAPLLESSVADDRPFFVTKYYRRSAQWLLDHPFTLSSRTLHALVSSIVEGLVELKLACGRPHGNLKPSNILIEGEGRVTSDRVVLSDPLPSSRLDAKTSGHADLHALGVLLYELVLRRRFRLMGGWPVPATEAWSRLGRTGETWRALCERLLDPDPARSRCSLDTVSEMLKRLDRPRKMRKYALAGVAAAAVIAVPLFFLLRSFQFPKIRVAGEKVIVAEAGISFNYPKFTATDRQDGELTAKVKLSGKEKVDRAVQDATLGEYTLSYSVTDSDGHSKTVRRTVNVVDRKPPYAAEFLPAASENVPVGQSISVRIKDDGVGVDRETVKMMVDGSRAERDRLSITGTERDYTVTYTPPDDFSEYKTVTVTVEAADRQGKKMKKKEYTFRTEDKTPPVMLAHKPARDETDVPIDTGITVTVKDDGAGVRKDLISLTVKEEGQEVAGTQEIVPEPGGYRIRWSPSRLFGEDRKVTVTVSATDLAQPAKLTTEEYGFATAWALPYVVGQKPGADEREVPASADIVLRVKDDGAGVDKSSLVLTVDASPVQPTIEGNPKDYEVRYRSPERFPEFKRVTVKVEAKDLDGREMKPVEYAFTTTDQNAPIVYDQSPAEGATVAGGAKVSFRIKDDGAGVDKGAIRITVDGAIVKPEIAEITPGSTSDFAVEFALPEGLAEDRTVKVAVDAADLYDPPNRMKTFARNFSTRQPPTTYGQSPAPGDQGVAVSAVVKLRVKDAGSGVKKDSINMTVNGWPVPKNLLKISGTVKDYEVSYDPPSDFQYNATINVTVEAEDISGNAMERMAYSFATGRGAVAKFTLHPQSVRVRAGVPVTFSLKADSPTAMQYQWTKDGKKVEGATSSSYAIPSVRPADAGIYVCEVTNLAGPVTSNPATLTIDEPPKIVLTSAEDLTWEMGTPFPDDQFGYTVTDKEDGDLAAKVELGDPVDRTKPGKYVILYRVKDSAGNEAQAAKTVHVADTRPPYVEGISPVGAAEGVPVGEKLTLRVKDDGIGVNKSSVKMAVNGSRVEMDRLSIEGSDKEYRVTYDPPEDFAEYKTVTVSVEAADRQGNAMQPQQYSFRTEDKTPPRVSRHEPGRDDKNVPVGTPITVHIEDDGAGVNPESIVVTVKAGDKPVGGERTATTEPRIAVWVPSAPFAYKENVAVVVEAKDALGNEMKPYAFTFTTAIGEVPRITLQPRSVAATAGAAVTLSIEATSPTEMQYQWKKDGDEIAGATSSSYTIPSVGQSNVGSYVCQVTNLAGQAITNRATVTIDEPPKIVLSTAEEVTWEMGTPLPETVAQASSPASGFYKATDKEDGDITAKVEVENQVNLTKPGKYAILYRVKDSAGNEARATKTVVVADTKAPYVADLSPASGGEVRGGDKISFHIKDNGVGVDRGSIAVTLDGTPAKSSIAPLGAGLKDYAVSLNLPDKLDKDKVVIVVDAKDLLDQPNAMATETYTFSVAKVPVSPEFDFEAFWKEYAADFPEPQKFKGHYLRQEDVNWYTTLGLTPLRIEWDQRELYSRLADEGGNVVFQVKFRAFFRAFARPVTETINEVWVIDPKTRKIVQVRKR